MTETKTLEVFDRKNFRKWLEKNHDKENKVALVIHKKHTGKNPPSHKELMEEAICFGWIDTTIKRLNKEKYIRHFSRRNKNSKWSDNTLSYGKDLIKRDLMTPVGLKYYKEGLSRPTHDHGIPKNPDMPPELEKELAKNKIAHDNFMKFPPSAKRTFYRWLLHAKTSETRDKRIKSIVEKAEAGNKDVFTPQDKINP